MSEEEAKQELMAGFEMLCNYARIIALLPLEDWRDALNRAETTGAFVDPTLMREYLYSDKPRVLKEIIDAAIKLKRVVLAAQSSRAMAVITRGIP